MARNSEVSASGKQSRKAPSRRKKSRSVLVNLSLGVGLTVAALVGASVVTMATAVKSASNVKFETALVSPHFSASMPAIAAAERSLDISKFSRLPGSASANPKAGRLAGAEVAALSARRPDASSLRDAVHVAMAKASRHSEGNQQFAALEKIRPEASAIKAVLGSAMASLVVVAPRGETALSGGTEMASLRGGIGETGDSGLPDLIQDAQTTAKVAELNDMKPVQMAALEQTALEDTGDDAGDSLSIAEETIPVPMAAPAQAPAAGLAYALPQAGPLPVIRPNYGTDKPAKPNALAAIAAVAPQKADKDTDEKPTVLAFARPDNPMRDDSSRPSPSVPGPAPNWNGIGTKVAVYDISGGMVYMPNGTKLEAHSGIGKMRDNPDFTHVTMRGPTPPGTYKLSMRESLFHGVAAIRLTPVDGKAPKGRTGLLAHSYLLRVRGDSHGCVAFAEYDRFLKAFQRGEITHMVIVPKYDGKRPGRGTNGGFLAKLFGGKDA
jgi:hypothetical protein